MPMVQPGSINATKTQPFECPIDIDGNACLIQLRVNRQCSVLETDFSLPQVMRCLSPMTLALGPTKSATKMFIKTLLSSKFSHLVGICQRDIV